MLKKILKILLIIINLIALLSCPNYSTHEEVKKKSTGTGSQPQPPKPPQTPDDTVTVQPTEFQYTEYSGPDFVPYTGTWYPPEGIPTPTFGITESVMDFIGKEFDYGSGLEPYRTNSSGEPYTHYIDNTSPDSTDSNNPYGTPSKPRKTIPYIIEASGSIVEVHGGPYKIGGMQRIQAYGTRQAPIYIRGALNSIRPVLTGKWYFSATYLIVENIDFKNANVAPRLFDRLNLDIRTVEYVSIRNNEFSEKSGSIISMLSERDTMPTNNIVIFNNFIHSDYFNPIYGIPYEQDGHGVTSGHNVEKVWIVDNQISHMTGDAIQIGHALKYSAKDFYIGRNKMFTCGENAIDTKETENIIISENIMYDFKTWDKKFNPDSNVGGVAVVIHYGPEFSTKNLWLISNTISDCDDAGIQIGGTQRHDVYLINNTIKNVVNDEKLGRGIVSWSASNNYLVNNNIFNVDIGINTLWEGYSTMLLYNNIIHSIDNEKGLHIFLMGNKQINAAKFYNNLFYQGNTNGIVTQFKSNISTMNGSEFDAFVTGDSNVFDNPANSGQYQGYDINTNLTELATIYSTTFGINLDLLTTLSGKIGVQ